MDRDLEQTNFCCQIFVAINLHLKFKLVINKEHILLQLMIINLNQLAANCTVKQLENYWQTIYGKYGQKSKFHKQFIEATVLKP